MSRTEFVFVLAACSILLCFYVFSILPSRWTRRWYLLVIVLLYVGLLASFSLNVSLLLRKQPSSTPANGDGADDDSDAGSAEARKGKSYIKLDRGWLLLCYLTLTP